MVRADLRADKLAIISNVHGTTATTYYIFQQSRSTITSNYLLFTWFHVISITKSSIHNHHNLI